MSGAGSRHSEYVGNLLARGLVWHGLTEKKHAAAVWNLSGELAHSDRLSASRTSRWDTGICPGTTVLAA